MRLPWSYYRLECADGARWFIRFRGVWSGDHVGKTFRKTYERTSGGHQIWKEV